MAFEETTKKRIQITTTLVGIANYSLLARFTWMGDSYSEMFAISKMVRRLLHKDQWDAYVLVAVARITALTLSPSLRASDNLFR